MRIGIVFCAGNSVLDYVSVGDLMQSTVAIRNRVFI